MSNNIEGGCFVINNDIIVTMPQINDTATYNLPFEKPCFFVNNNLISPLVKNYDLTLKTPLTLEKYDILKIKIKIPKQIFGIKYGYSLDDFVSNIICNNDFKADIHIKSSSGHFNIQRYICNDNELTIDDYCGCVIISINYQVLEEEIYNIYNLSYSLCFKPVRLNSLYGFCHPDNDEEVDFETETCLELTKTEINKKVCVCFNVDDSNINNINFCIIGPESFNCLILKQDSELHVRFNKLSKTLTIKGDFKNSVNSDLLKQKIEKYNGFCVDLDNSYELYYIHFNNHFTQDKFITHIIPKI